MNRYNPNIHHRRSIRLKGYDYAQAGLYFITICLKDRACLFGNVVNGKMILNDPGKMVGKWYNELENKFPDIQCGEHVTMPNHFHAIIINNGNGNPNIMQNTVGADTQVCPNTPTGEHPPILGEHVGSPLHRVVQWFKTMSTNEYIRGVKNNGWQPFNGKLWQRNYWEHIIRNEKSYHAISQYIINNPMKWQNDKFYASWSK